MDLQKYCDNNRAQNGYGGAWMYRDPSLGETLYHILIPVTTVPFVNGSVDTSEYDSLNCRTKGMVEGKENLEQKDVDFLWHRDNIKRLESLQGRMIEFLSLDKNYNGRTYSGTLKVRPQDFNNEINMGTVTITPASSTDKTIFNCLDLMQDTVWFASEIPDKKYLYSANTSTAVTLDAKVDTEGANVAITFDEGASTSDIVTATWSTGTLSLTAKAKGSTVVNLTATKEGMASWTTTILVIVE